MRYLSTVQPIPWPGPAQHPRRYTCPPTRSFNCGGLWLTDDAWLWNIVDDYGTCVPVNPWTLVRWINDCHGLH